MNIDGVLLVDEVTKIAFLASFSIQTNLLKVEGLTNSQARHVT